MTKDIDYPLEQVLMVKKRRVDAAEKVVKERIKALEQEEKKLIQVKKEHNEVLTHREDKLAKLRHELDTGTTSDKIEQGKRYLDIVNEKLQAEDKKVAEQEKQVEQAKKNLAEAKEQLAKRRQEVDKLETHKEEWLVEMKKELRIAEGRKESELGSLMHLTHKFRRRGK